MPSPTSPSRKGAFFQNNHHLESALSYQTLNHCYTTNRAALTTERRVFCTDVLISDTTLLRSHPYF
jgi:hypothetical protein